MNECQCLRCLRLREERTAEGLPVELGRMVVCSTCGCKRCPHATDHRQACTNSNEAGQAGSVYGVPPADLPPTPAPVWKVSAPPGRAMRPTENLRFLERVADQGDGTARRVRVLQQAWAPVHGGQCEWRDVPLVTE